MFAENYTIVESLFPDPTNTNFRLHNHNEYEILLFIEGDAKYVVEDKTYTLEPYDIIIIRKNELHRIYHNSQTPYRRLILWVNPAFFANNNCPEYEKQFLKAPLNVGHKIPASLVRSSGLLDAFLRYKKYSENFSLDGNIPILQTTIVEILYLINKITVFSAADTSKNSVKNIILYINNHYTEDLSLDLLENKFFISKYYLCRAFRKATGLTIHEYIRRKRLTKVRELCDTGLSISNAAIQAGFGDYSSFYRAYQKEYGVSPSSDL